MQVRRCGVMVGLLPLTALAIVFAFHIALADGGKRSDGMDAAAWYTRAMKAMSEQNGKGAVAAMKKAIALEPKNAVFHETMGNILSMENRVAEAVESYRSAVSLDPTAASAHYSLGVAYTVSKDTAKARLQQQVLAGLAPEQPLAGMMAEDLKRFIEAIEQCSGGGACSDQSR